MAGAFRDGEACLLLDSKGRRYFLTLASGREFQYHNGTLPHDAIIGIPDGSVLASSKGSRLIALRPRLADYVLKMRRGAQVVYPKDTGPILVYGDIGPGTTVLEAGTGSGALTMALTRAVGPGGRVVSVERREDHAAHARKQIAAFFGEVPPNLDLRVGDVEDLVEEIAPDRMVLDLPEPWHAAEACVGHLQPGGVFCSYLPTVPQVQELRAALSRTRRFIETTTFEVFLREWAIEGRSVRPEHQMIGHTGFLTVSRMLATEL